MEIEKAPQLASAAKRQAKAEAIVKRVDADERPNVVALGVGDVQEMHDAGMSAEDAIKTCVALLGEGHREKVGRMIRHSEWGEWAVDNAAG